MDLGHQRHRMNWVKRTIGTVIFLFVRVSPNPKNIGFRGICTINKSIYLTFRGLNRRSTTGPKVQKLPNQDTGTDKACKRTLNGKSFFRQELFLLHKQPKIKSYYEKIEKNLLVLVGPLHAYEALVEGEIVSD